MMLIRKNQYILKMSKLVISISVFLMGSGANADQPLQQKQPLFSGISKATEDPKVRQAAIDWMTGEIKRNTGCNITAINASSPFFVDSVGAKQGDIPKQIFEIWSVEACGKKADMLLRFDVDGEKMRFNAEQIK